MIEIFSKTILLVARQNWNGGVARQSTADTNWRTPDIIYVSIVGTIMLAATLEWFLWLAAFLYCLIKVYQKAENGYIKSLAAIMMILFTSLRATFLPVMIVTLPLPQEITRHFPPAMVSALQWFAFWTFSVLLVIPWLICVFQLVTHSVGRNRRIRHVLNEKTAPKVVIIMPCYKELPEILLRTVDSVVRCDYPSSCLHLFLSFDGDQQDDLYMRTIEKLGVPMTLKTYPQSIDLAYADTRVTVSRFRHGGKRHCQKQTFRLIDKIYSLYTKHHDDLFVLFIDSDCILDKVCIQNFMYEMELRPGSKRNMLAMTGVITSTTEKNSLITILQDVEYIHGQLFERSVESGCGAVTCLPGALTILRFSAFRKMAKYYFADKAEQCDDLFDYGKCHLGEDRWLTHLFMIGAVHRYQIQMNTGAFCKTEAVQSFRSLLKQRRRWFLGFITNEVCMLTDVRLWKKYPVLCLVRFAQNTIRTTALLFFIMVISLITTSQKISQLPVGFIAVSLGLNWALMLYFAACLGRYKIVLYPLMFVINPFLNWLYMVYGIFTAGQRTWGGPRADAGAADTETSPEEAIKHAEATGDDLNVVPETFKPAIELMTRRKSIKSTVQPPDQVEGRFTAASSEGITLVGRDEEYGSKITDMELQPPIRRRHSAESWMTSRTGQPSITTPRRVEGLLRREASSNLYWTPPTGPSLASTSPLETHNETPDPLNRPQRSRTMPEQIRQRPERSVTPVTLVTVYPSPSRFDSSPSSPELMPASFNPYATRPTEGFSTPSPTIPSLLQKPLPTFPLYSKKSTSAPDDTPPPPEGIDAATNQPSLTKTPVRRTRPEPLEAKTSLESHALPARSTAPYPAAPEQSRIEGVDLASHSSPTSLAPAPTSISPTTSGPGPDAPSVQPRIGLRTQGGQGRIRPGTRQRIVHGADLLVRRVPIGTSTSASTSHGGSGAGSSGSVSGHYAAHRSKVKARDKSGTETATTLPATRGGDVEGTVTSHAGKGKGRHE